MLNATFAGFLTGLSLIVAIGAQNAYLLRLGLTRNNVGAAVAICATSDVVLILLGSIGNQFGSNRWLFAAGAGTASIAWFLGLGYGAKAMAPLTSRPLTWRVLDLVIGVVMLAVAFNVA